MIRFSSKTALLAALIALGSLAPDMAHANILRTRDGVPVTTKDGDCVYTGDISDTPCPLNAAKTGAFDKDRTVYFEFNSSKLTREAKHKLDKLAWHLRHMEQGKMHEDKRHHHPHHMKKEEGEQAGLALTIVGYADRIGNPVYNEKLAMRRARAVRDYLIGKGVRPRHIEVRSLGETAPQTSCPANMPRKKLIHCLREDRRVEIEIDGK